MDYYYCRSTATNTWDCAAFQPENNADGVAQRYPRFGSNESAAGYVGYSKFSGGSNAATFSSDWSIQYNGANAFVAAAAASVIASLAF